MTAGRQLIRIRQICIRTKDNLKTEGLVGLQEHELKFSLLSREIKLFSVDWITKCFLMRDLSTSSFPAISRP